MQNRKHGSVADRVQKFVGMPGRGQRPGFRFSVTNHDVDNQVGIVEGRTKSMRNAVSQFPALVNGARHFWRAMAAQLTGKRERLKQAKHAGFVLTLGGVDLRVSSFKVAVGKHGGCSMPRTRQINHVQIVLADDAVQMDPCECLAGI